MKVSVSRFYENLISSLKRSNWLLTIYLTNLPNAPSLKSEDILSAQSFHDFTPSWQNDIESIKRAGDDLVTLGAMVDSVLSGYCVFSPKSGDITQIAVDPTFRRKGVASSLLKQMIEMTESEIVKVINVESPTPSLDAFLASKGVCLAGKQFEMVLTL